MSGATEGAMPGTRMTRRMFVGTALGTAATAALAPRLATAARARSRPTAPEDAADLILTNANVITMNAAQPAAEAVAIASGRILAVGSPQDVLQWAGPATEVRDLGQQTLIPGLYDSHNHML